MNLMEEQEKQFAVYDKLGEVHETLKQLLGLHPDEHREQILKLIGMVADAEDALAPEPVTVDSTPAEGGCAAIGWVMMGGLTVSLTRSSRDGALLVGVENTVNSGLDARPLDVRIELTSGGGSGPLWEGVVH